MHWSEQMFFQPQKKIKEEKLFLTPCLVKRICFTCLVFWQSTNCIKDRTWFDLNILEMAFRNPSTVMDTVNERINTKNI